MATIKFKVTLADRLTFIIAISIWETLFQVVTYILLSKQHRTPLLECSYYGCFAVSRDQICPGLNANEIQIPYDKHHKVSSLVKRHQNTHNSVKYEVI